MEEEGEAGSEVLSVEDGEEGMEIGSPVYEIGADLIEIESPRLREGEKLP